MSEIFVSELNKQKAGGEEIARSRLSGPGA